MDRKLRTVLLALGLLLRIGVSPATESSAASEPVLTFVEVRVEMRGHAGNALRQRANAAGEHQAASEQTVMLQEIARPERFAVLERVAPGVATADITDDLIAPPDRRSNREFDETGTTHGSRVDARANFYVITHVDIAASDRTPIATALHKLAVAARQSNGNLGFEILQQTDRPNHFNLVSAWLGEASFRTFSASAGAREFRQTIAPLLGSPYDERLFRRVD